MGLTISNYKPTKKPNTKAMPGATKARFERFWKLYFPVITKYERKQKLEAAEVKAVVADAKKGRDLFWKLANRSKEHYPKETVEAFTMAYFHMDHIIDQSRMMGADDVTYKPKTAKPGDKGSTVKGYQALLKAFRFYKKKVDGDYGGGTVEAVKLFQKKYHVRVDGKIGSDTAAKVVEVAKERGLSASEIRKIC